MSGRRILTYTEDLGTDGQALACRTMWIWVAYHTIADYANGEPCDDCGEVDWDRYLASKDFEDVMEWAGYDPGAIRDGLRRKGRHAIAESMKAQLDDPEA